MRLTTKYPLTIVTVALIASLVTGVVAYEKSKKELRLGVEQQMIEILESRKASLQVYLKSIEQDLSLLARNKFTRDALIDFTRAWSQLPGNPSQILKHKYFHNKFTPTGDSETQNIEENDSEYSNAHDRFHPWFSQFIDERGYNDLILFDTDGNLIYTVLKELDFATNVKDNKNSDLARGFRSTTYNLFPEFQIFFDFKPYEIIGGVLSSFILSPVFDDDENFIGVLGFRMSIERVNEIIQFSGATQISGRVHIIAEDMHVRNDPNFSNASEIIRINKPEEIVNTALTGVSGIRSMVDGKGTEMLVTFTSVNFGGQAWAIISEAALADILAPVNEMRRYLIIAGLIIGFVVTGTGIWFAIRLSDPIVAMTNTMKRLAKGDLEVEVPASGRTDEIGDMAGAMEVFKENAVERQRAETAVKESEERLSTAIETIADGFVTTDPDGHIVLFNSRFKKLYPNSVDLIKPGTTYEDFLRGGAQRGEFPDAIDQPDEWVREQIRKREKNLSIVEMPLIGDRWVRVASRQLPDGGRVDLHVDLTELKEIQERLALTNDELQELNEIKNKFMGMAAHDLRNPIGAIHGMSKLIMELDLDEIKEREFISSINTVSQQMLNLLNDLLDVSAIESGRFDLKWEEGNLGELLKSRVDLAAFSAKGKGITINTDISDVPVIMFDHARIHQVIDNLITNAIKFSPAGSVIDTSVHSEDSTVYVVVRDYGQGIPADEIDQIFVPFTKLSVKPTAGEKSTGLGMAIVKQIVDAHGGDISVKSTLGEGSTFTLSLSTEANKGDES